MSTTGMGRLLRSDNRFEKIGDSWYLAQSDSMMGMNIKPIWVVSILINLFGIIHNIQYDISSKSVLLLNIALIALCLYMLFAKRKSGKKEGSEAEPESEAVPDEDEENPPDLGSPDV